MEIGISTFGDIQADHVAGKAVNAHARMQELLAEGKLADEIGLDVFALGEHHRPDFLISAPEVILAGVAAITKNIRLSSAVTVLSSADPVRVFQNFSTLDLMSSGRAEVMAGRGSFIESFPLFGYDLNDYNELFTEHLELLLKINQEEIISWKGKHRAAINKLGVYPRPYQEKLPVWLAVGGTPASMVRAGNLNLPVTLAILGSDPDHFVPLVELYRSSARKAGHDDTQLPLAINCHFYIADSSEQASDEFFPVYEKMMNRIGKERGWGKLTRDQFEYMRSPKGSLFVGNVQEVIDKVMYQHKLFNHTRFLAQIISGDIPHHKLLHSIELLGKEVAPVVRKQLKK
ncbi:MAG TPA: LLM class flavin-dependent oxidoreductase [Cytophagaceae bacterium]|nr:LLM class flavin-dependent oxidoreductase [Cytophagaceae bacterium]